MYRSVTRRKSAAGSPNRNLRAFARGGDFEVLSFCFIGRLA